MFLNCFSIKICFKLCVEIKYMKYEIRVVLIELRYIYDSEE